MPQVVTRYNVLISRPSDANNEAVIAKECIELTNDIYSDESLIYLNPVDWTKNSYADSGDRPQALLNKQLVDKADIVIAIFKERYGTPTKEYGSGTEEEIMLALNAGKRVMLYCCSCKNKNILEEDEERRKIADLKERVQNKVLYKEYDDITDLRKILNHNLGHLVFELEDSAKTSSNMDISICCIDENNLKTSRLTFLQGPSINNSDAFSMLESEVQIKVEQINDLSSKMKSERENKENQGEDGKLRKTPNDAVVFKLPSACFGNPVKIDEEEEREIVRTLNRLHIDISNTFFELGDLIEMRSVISSLTGGMDLFGSDNEKAKYKQLLSLAQLCKLANQLNDYKENVRNECLLGLVICNMDNRPLTHISVELRFPADSVIRPTDIAHPGSVMLETVKDKWAANRFIIQESEDFLPFEKTQRLSESGVKLPYVFTNEPVEFLGTWSYPAFDEDDLREQINTIFEDYYFVPGINCNQDIIRIQMDYLQHGSSYAFPTYILLKKEVEKITYKITADEYARSIEGELSEEL